MAKRLLLLEVAIFGFWSLSLSAIYGFWYKCLSPMHASNGSQAGLWTTKKQSCCSFCRWRIKPIWPSGIIPMGLADVFGYVYQVVSMGLWSRPWIILWGRSWRPHWNLLWGIWLQLDGFLGFGHSWALWQTGLVGLAGITGGCLWVHCLCHGCWFLLPLWASVGVHMNMYIWKQLIEYKYGDIAWYTILVLRLSSM